MTRAFVLLGLVACSRTTLAPLPEPPEPPFDNRLRVDGEVCTSNPEDLVFPSRVMFLVDASESMRLTDPPDPITGETRREAAVREALEDLLVVGRDAKVSLVRFSSQAQALTIEVDGDGNFVSYFTDDLQYALNRLPAVSQTDRTTNFTNVLGEAYSEIRDELSRADRESLALTSYQVVLVTDGLPSAESGTREQILEAVEGLSELRRIYRLQRLAFHTVLLEAGDVQADLAAEELLEAMSSTGEGAHRSIEAGSAVSFLDLGLTALQRVFTLDGLMAVNLNTLSRGDAFETDSDDDGVSDLDESRMGTDPRYADTDGDGCRDSVEATLIEAGLDPLDPDDCACFVPEYCFDDDKDGICDNGCTDADGDDLCDCIDIDEDGRCDPSNYADSDGDGLVDCEERWTGTLAKGNDTDADGLLDFVELRSGTAPDLADGNDDLDFDVIANAAEVRTGTDPRFVSTEGRYDLAYRYTLQTQAWTGGESCYGFSVANISLNETLPSPSDAVLPEPLGQGSTGRNRVLLVAGEVPYDDRNSFARYRVACVEAWVRREGNLRSPPSGRVHVRSEDFVEL
ncbi:MAG: VWA domain-containing protein, partial [Myxococcota bacterium]